MSEDPRILILSIQGDAHAHAVALQLKREGIQCDIWDQTAYPAKQRASLWIASGEAVHTSFDKKAAPYSTVWARRFGSALDLKSHVHPDDLEAANRECRHFLNALRFSVAQNSFWINPYDREIMVNSKAVQLRLADEAGLCIPPTLMSNDADQVRAFISDYERVIYKPYFPERWDEDEQVRYTFTKEVSLMDITDTEALQFCPGIFQPMIDKAYEVRLTFMGHEALAARIDIPEPGEAQIDWRVSHVSQDDIHLSPCAVPDDVKAGCLAMMAKTGSVFGCFDFIVDYQGQWHFLEVNPMGQFLWVELMCPEIPMLETFCNFLLSGQADFTMDKHKCLTDISAPQIFRDEEFDTLMRNAGMHGTAQKKKRA